MFSYCFVDTFPEGEQSDRLISSLYEECQPNFQITRHFTMKPTVRCVSLFVCTVKPVLTLISVSHLCQSAYCISSFGFYSALGLTIQQREEIGHMCKRVLDAGRLEFLRKNGLTGNQVQYVKPSVTLENIMILANRREENWDTLPNAWSQLMPA